MFVSVPKRDWSLLLKNDFVMFKNTFITFLQVLDKASLSGQISGQVLAPLLTFTVSHNFTPHIFSFILFLKEYTPKILS